MALRDGLLVQGHAHLTVLATLLANAHMHETEALWSNNKCMRRIW